MSVGIAVLGCTGSIGVSTLRVIERQRERFRVVALTAFGSRDKLEQVGDETGATYLGLVNGEVGWRRSSNGTCRRATGPECLIEAATHSEVDIVVNAVVGAAGLQATVAALERSRP